MSEKLDLLTPIGRLVQGDLYEPNTKDPEGNPLVIRTGVNAGEPRVNFYFAVAISKKQEAHWNQTEWGAKMYSIGMRAFPQVYTSRNFAWKIIDGDSQEPNSKGRKPVDNEGYAGHWILKFSGGFAPQIYNANGTQTLVEKDHVNLGDYIQVFGSVASNESSQQPGLFLNFRYVAFAGFGKRIIMGPDPKSVGFGNSEAPAELSHVPVEQGFNPGSIPLPLVSTIPEFIPPNVPPVPVTPHAAILSPPSAPTPKVMLPAAQGFTYEQLISNGWTDQTLIQHGMIQP